jgi:cell division septation protein DedD
MSEEGFHEIQLNGKQLVFLFITVTVVSVVIFLCGVLVGRGVRAERTDTTVDSSVAPVPVAPQPVAQGDAASTPPASTQAAATTDPATAAPQPADDDLSYYKRLEGDDAKEQLKARPEPKSAATAGGTPPRAATSTAANAPPPKPAAEQKPQPIQSTEPPGEGFAVQVTALRDVGEANAIVKRLAGKGYPAYVVPPPAGGAAAVYRVRVGKYKNRREAEDIKTRLEKEEQFRTWISR